VRLADFGFSCVFDPEKGLNLGLGSPLFMAPEIFERKTYNEKVDIWSMGVITYMLLSGCAPFDGQEKAVIMRKVVYGEPDMRNSYIRNISQPAKDFLA
jgi:serine/threonine protein kinase